MRMIIIASKRRNRAMTLIDLFIILAVIAVLAALVLRSLSKSRDRDIRYTCLSNLKQVGLASIIWASDHGTNFPMDLSATNGGSAEFVTGPNAFRHFQVMSNELFTPKVLLCPAEESGWKKAATNWIDFSNSNISYFVSVDARDTNANMILAGDHNITNGAPLRNGLLELTGNRPAGWTSRMHKRVGNIALADGSVQEDSNTGLRRQIAAAGVATNRLQMP